jgi:hypothetical protein
MALASHRETSAVQDGCRETGPTVGVRVFKRPVQLKFQDRDGYVPPTRSGSWCG